MKQIFILCILILLLTACEDQQTDTSTTDLDYFKGGIGLKASFEQFGVDENGIQTIYDTDGFPIEIRLKNEGEYDIQPQDITIELKGINLNDFTNIPYPKLQNSLELEGLSEFNTEGDEEVIDFTPDGDAFYKHEVTGAYQPDVFGSIEYYYETEIVIPKVCFKEDTSDDSLCEISASLNPHSSGGPISVSSAEQHSAGRGIIGLTIGIINTGCERTTTKDSEFSSTYDSVGFELLTDTDGWECKSAGKTTQARLSNDKATISCRLKNALEEDALYTKQMNLKLKYKCKTTISQSLRIKESAE